MAWQVFLYGIQWDEGHPDDGNDTSELPDNLRVTISDDDAEEESDAIELALTEATDEFGFLIEGTEQIVVKRASDALVDQLYGRVRRKK